ncbi:MAG: 3-dehydroquinate synthase [Deltaproteobacteria bacterium]|nr:3-dehydroquinate synthase [Deltaproteobacteria bacterium]
MKLIANKLSKVYLGHNELSFISQTLNKNSYSCFFFVISHSVPKTYIKKIIGSLNKEYILFYIKDGETNKNFSQFKKILNELFKNKLDRESVLISIGGGSLNDLAGFCASIYLRGIDWMTIPTTPLSQMDASMGGKTALNYQGKNTIGSFYLPHSIFIDTIFLKTVSKTILKESFSEMIKMALGFDQKLYSLLLKKDLSQTNNLHRVFTRCIQLKEKVVIQDFREKKGLRQKLNFGHTLGHVFEQSQKISHGKAVQEGLKTALFLSKKLRCCTPKTYDKCIELLNKFNTNGMTTFPPSQTIKKFLYKDKKRKKGEIDFIFLEKIGTLKVKKIQISELINYVSSYS